MTTLPMMKIKILITKKPVLFGGCTKEKVPMSEANALDRIMAYRAENRIITALEAEAKQKLALEAIIFENNEINPNIVNRPEDAELHTYILNKVEEEGIPVTQRLDCIYDDEPFGFEKDPQISTKRMQAQDPLEEIDLEIGR